MTKKSRMFRRAAAVLAAAAVAATLGVQPAQAISTNKDKKFLVVYNNNIENLAGCDGNYTKFIAYLKKQKKSPDIFTVQQISNAKQLASFTKRLSDELPGSYKGIIAVSNPGSMGYTSGCKVKKNQQTNAIIYRTGRLTPEKTVKWRSLAPYHYADGPCQELYGSYKSSQDRVVNVAVRFHDNVAGKDVTVAAVHWPTNTWSGPRCAAQNMRATNTVVEKLGGKVKIVAGDMNATKGEAGWWTKARTTYKYRDVVWDSACAPKTKTKKANTCPDSTSTNGDRRIDYLLTKGGHKATNVATISNAAVGGKYSGHQALRAYVTY